MSIIGLLDSRITVYRISQSNPDKFGDVARIPGLVTVSARASFQVPRLRANDEGPGEAVSGQMMLYVQKNEDIAISDVIYARKGPLAGTWWSVLYPYGVSRSPHKEALVKPYVGAKPDIVP